VLGIQFREEKPIKQEEKRGFIVSSFLKHKRAVDKQTRQDSQHPDIYLLNEREIK
jgi:hypothetical protein